MLSKSYVTLVSASLIKGAGTNISRRIYNTYAYQKKNLVNDYKQIKRGYFFYMKLLAIIFGGNNNNWAR